MTLKNNLTVDAKNAQIFTKLFNNIVDTLNIESYENIFCDAEIETNPLTRVIKKYSKHRILLKIRKFPNIRLSSLLHL